MNIVRCVIRNKTRNQRFFFLFFFAQNKAIPVGEQALLFFAPLIIDGK